MKYKETHSTTHKEGSSDNILEVLLNRLMPSIKLQ